MKNNSFANRLKRAIDRSGKTYAEISEQTGISPSSISDWIKGRYEAKQDKIFLLANVLDVMPSWLMGQGTDIPLNGSSKIPLLSSSISALPILLEENIVDYVALDSRYKADFCLEILDDSMVDEEIHKGDIAFFSQQDYAENGEISAVIIDQEIALKTVFKTEDSLILQPANKAQRAIVIDRDKVKIAGKLTSVLNLRK